MTTAYEKLSTLLKELFQLDQADLDFGIYRIMNQKRGEITRFLDHDLLPQVKTAFEQYRPADKNVLQEKLDQASQAAATAGFDPEQSPKVKEIREQIAHYSVDTVALENEVYSNLYSFFRRYYNEGDFISARRYKEGVYAIPYEGEEVKLHWANADQYYVKTSENFRDYSFRLPSGRLAHFKIMEAETEKDNVKTDADKERRFILAPENPITVEDDALILRFAYRADLEKRDQKSLNTLAAATILTDAPVEWSGDLKTLAPTESNPKRTLLEKHLTDYTARNTFDYFIHKDLRTFLRRELDFYIKNEVMRLDDIEDEGAPQVEQYLSKIKVIRQVAHKIIEFLAQIENFQKKLWLKKKFVVETNFCITLDRVPEELYPEICANDAQREEWVRLFAIDEIKGEQPAQPELGETQKPGFSVPMTVAFLKANPFLVLDTKFFGSVFVARFIATIEKIDDQLDGILIHSENFQALRFLQEHYNESIKGIYIDPPYNTGKDGFPYKDNVQHSSWLSMMQNRIWEAYNLLKSTGVIFISIDDNEEKRLLWLLDSVFSSENFVEKIIWKKRSTPPNDRIIGAQHEYIPIYSKDIKNLTINLRDRSEKQLNNYKNPDNHPKGPWSAGDLLANVKGGRFVESLFFPIINPNNNQKHYPSAGGNWRFSQKTIQKLINNNEIYFGLDGKGKPKLKRFLADVKSGMSYTTIWDFVPLNTQGSQDMSDFFGSILSFENPKPVGLIEEIIKLSNSENEIFMDFFAGSGTTGHSIINLNNFDNKNRKYVLVEMGDYFNTITKPRIQKVIYSEEWKDGKPVTRNGSSHCFKYLRLESYEDALNNLTLQRTNEQQLALEANTEFKENYMLSYMLDLESQNSLLNIQSFVHPFDYQLNIATGTVGESKPTRVDLVETFNYLIGLHVETIQSIRGFRVITGKNPDGERTLIIWRDLEEKDNAALEAFFRKQDYNPRDMEFDLIYVNGDNNLENLRRPDETWKVRLIEEEFLRLMFEES